MRLSTASGEWTMTSQFQAPDTYDTLAKGQATFDKDQQTALRHTLTAQDVLEELASAARAERLWQLVDGLPPLTL